LAQKADERSIEVSLTLCMIKLYQSNDTQFVNETLSMTVSELLARLDFSQSQGLLLCDRDNRAHSQKWLVYSYLQTGRYWMSVGVLKDLMLSYNISDPDNFYLPYVYNTRAFIVIDAFFWIMYDKQRNHARFLRSIDEILVDSQPIKILTDNTTTSSYSEQGEFLARFGMLYILVFCIRALLHYYRIFYDRHTEYYIIDIS
jgi:hypothetical protein